MTWKSAPIASFCAVGTGGTPLREQASRFYGGNIPWVKSGELREKVIFDTEEHITEAGLAESAAKMVPAGALLVALYGATVGRIAELGVPAATNQAVCHIVPDEKMADRRYLFYALRTKVPEWLSRRVGGAQPNISNGIIKETLIPLPPLAEQKRIAAVLDKADDLRGKRRQALATLDTLLQSVFLDMFGDPVTNQKGWDRRTLGEVTAKITDGEHLNPEFSHSGMPIVMAGNVRDGGVELDDCKMVETQLGERFRKKCNPEAGDLLLVSRGATIGRLCAVGNGPEFCLMGSVILIKRLRDVMDCMFLREFLKHPVTQSKLYNTSGSSAQQAMYLKDIKRLTCLVPPLPLQLEYAKFVAACDKLKVPQLAALAESDILFAALQSAAFAGTLFSGERATPAVSLSARTCSGAAT